MNATRQIVLYRLNPDGTMPEFVSGSSVSGMFLKYDPTTPSPQDHIMLGISDYVVTIDTPSIVDILDNKEKLSSYLNEILPETNQQSPQDSNGELIPIDIPAQIESIWELYESFNA